MRKFEKICKMTQIELKKFVYSELIGIYGKHNVTSKDGFVFALGKVPVLLLAHLDTVHKETPHEIICDKTISSPQGIGGDDRCGVYMILEIIKQYRCSVLFCEDEEIGGVGATKFINTFKQKLDLNYMLEFDRANANDAVFYDCDNAEFEEFITKDFYKTAYGCFSDISVVAPALGIAAANLSCGYYKAHTTSEYVVFSEMKASIKAAKNIIAQPSKKFEYIDATDYYSHTEFYSEMCYIIEYSGGQWAMEMAISEEEAVGKFLIKHPDLCYYDITYIDVDTYTF